MVKDYPYIYGSMPALDTKWPVGLMTIMKQFSTYVSVVDPASDQQDGMLSFSGQSLALQKPTALISTWKASPLRKPSLTSPMKGERFSMKIYDDKA